MADVSSRRGRPVVVMVMWVLVGVLVGVSVAEELSCGRGCHCWTKVMKVEKEYRVICNETTEQEVMLSEAVFPQKKPSGLVKTYVRVELPQVAVVGAQQDLVTRQLRVTEGFVNTWRQYISCALDVWGGRLLLPEVPAFLPAPAHLFTHYSAGLGLVNVTLDVLPGDLFSGKLEAKVRLSGCSVGRISAGLLRGTTALQSLEIEHSTVGVLEGPLGPRNLRLTGKKRPLTIHNSTLGILMKGALRVRVSGSKDMMFEDVTLGLVSEGAIDLSGRARLIFNRCRVADLQQEALKVDSGSSVIITNSWMNVRPGSLSHLPCAYDHHHIHSNNVQVLPGNSLNDLHDTRDSHVSSNDTLDFVARERLVEELDQALHTSCVGKNLPSWLPQPVATASSAPLKDDNWLLHTGLYTFVSVSVLALIFVAVLACLLASARRRSPLDNNQVVIMSQLPDDPIYEEPPYCSPPPPVPAPTTLLRQPCRQEDTCAAKGGKEDTCAAKGGKEDTCSVSRQPERAVENEYMMMR